jgi:AhpD family alkylhydroperoxidase
MHDIQGNLGTYQPDSYKALAELDRRVTSAAADSGLGERLAELVKIRVSQLNGCSFCLRMHTRDAIRQGETPDRLAVLAAWWESHAFNDTERAALQFAEQATFPGDHCRLPERRAVYPATLTDRQKAAVLWLTITINAWNRLAVFGHRPAEPDPTATDRPL